MDEKEPLAGLPAFFIDMLRGQYGPDDVDRIVEGCAATRPVTARVNTLKGDAAGVRRELDGAGIGWEPVGWYGDAVVMPQTPRRDVEALDAYRQGRIYLQSLSSMIPPLVLAPRPGADVLDMCAAPGGKTCQMAALTAGAAHITACEMHMPRAERLEHNLNMQGARGVALMRCDARRLDPYFSFDQILVDAPCSGSGTLDVRDRRMASRFTPALVEKSVRSQKALLKKAVELLKPGECLVYSTCSILRQENEAVVRWLLGGGKVALEPVDCGSFEGVPLLPQDLAGTLKVCPDGMYEGFFVARLRKSA